MAHKLAKDVTKKSIIDISINIGKTKIKGIIKQILNRRWLKQWEEERKERWFYRVQRKVGEMRCGDKSRREESVLARLRFGHTGTAEHVIMQRERYEKGRRQMRGKFRKEKVSFDLIHILHLNSNKCLRVTNLVLKI